MTNSAAAAVVERPAAAPSDAVLPAPISVLLCDDHALLSDAMSMLIGMDARFELLTEPFNRAAPAIAAASILQPDVVLMDFDLPGGIDGAEAAREITQRSPETKVVILSGSGDPDELLIKAIEAGAVGFLSKTEAATEILDAVETAATGELLIDPNSLGTVFMKVAEMRAAQEAIDARVSRLTSRELQILERVANGESNEDIAAELVLSVHTVHTHVRNVLTKLDFHSKLEAVAWAVKAGVISVD